MKKKVYTILVEHFKRWGITHVFGIPGKSVSPLMLEVDSQEIKYVLSRHEAGAGFEAGGYALTKKTIGVAIGTAGPGGSNLLTSAGQAKEFQLPVLFITGHPSVKDTGKALGQDSTFFGTDLVKMFEPVTLFSARVDRGDLLYMYLRHAIEKACTGLKGPVHLCIPFDILMEEIEDFTIQLPSDSSSLVTLNLDEIIPLINFAKKPVLFLGKGAVLAEAYEEVRGLAEHWSIPVITSPGGKGAFPTNHPLSLGSFGLGGTASAIEYFKSGVDLMIIVGSKLSDMSISGFSEDMYPEQVIHFEYDQTFVGKSIPVSTHFVRGDIKNNLKKLLEIVDIAPQSYENIPKNRHVQLKNSDESKPLSASTAIKTLRENIPSDALLIGDSGSHSIYAVRDYEIYQPGTFYFDEVFATMGNGIGYSIGAKIGAPERSVICLTGDGCVMMHGTEIGTAVDQQMPVIFVVFNNGRLDMVDKGMSYNTGKSVGAVYRFPVDITKFAESMGARAIRCHTEVDISEAMSIALISEGPTVIEIMVDPLEIPPILTRLLTLD